MSMSGKDTNNPYVRQYMVLPPRHGPRGQDCRLSDGVGLFVSVFCRLRGRWIRGLGRGRSGVICVRFRSTGGRWLRCARLDVDVAELRYFDIDRVCQIDVTRKEKKIVNMCSTWVPFQLTCAI